MNNTHNIYIYIDIDIYNIVAVSCCILPVMDPYLPFRW